MNEAAVQPAARGLRPAAAVLMTHAVFGVKLIRYQLARAGLSWFGDLARYMATAVRMGFTPYGAFTYFVYYAGDHLVEPYLAPVDPKPTLMWRAMRTLAGLVLPHSGQPPPDMGEPEPDSADPGSPADESRSMPT